METERRWACVLYIADYMITHLFSHLWCFRSVREQVMVWHCFCGPQADDISFARACLRQAASVKMGGWGGLRFTLG